MRYCIFFIIILSGCSKYQNSTTIINNPKIILEPIAQINEEVSYLKLDTLQNKYLISYSNPIVKSGGYRISAVDSTGAFSTLIQKPHNNIHYVYTLNNFIGFIENNFEREKLKSKLIYSTDDGKSWETLETPLESIRSFFWNEHFFIVEGNLNGNGNIIFSNNDGEKWTDYNYTTSNLKSMYLVDFIEKDIIVNAYQSYNHKDGYLGILDTKKFNYKEVMPIKNDSQILKVISKSKNLYCISKNNKVFIYSLQKGVGALKIKCSMPKEMKQLKEVYLDDACLIVTAFDEKGSKNPQTWISYNNGDNWKLLERDKKLSLVQNSLGKIFFKDSNNKIYRAELTIKKSSSLNFNG